MNLAVVLVSEQTIPNVIYLKNLLMDGKVFDKILLITTKRMENEEDKKSQSDVILKALDPEFMDDEKHYKLIVDEKMLFEILKVLRGYFEKNKFDKIYVNITGGNKIMSLATYKFFDQLDDDKVEMVYLPIGSINYKQIKPIGSDGRAIDIPLKVKLSVNEYFESLGIEYEDSGPINPDLSKYLFKAYLEHSDIMNDVTQILRKYRDEKERRKLKQSEDYSKVQRMLNEIGVSLEKEGYNLRRKRWVDFFSGGWFEEYVYLKVKGMCVDDAKLNVQIKRETDIKDVKNEFDVVFTKDNNLYVIECKTGDMESEKITSSLYKVAQLNSDLGLSANSYFISLSRAILSDETKKTLTARSKLLKVKMVFRDELETKGIDGVFEKFQCK